MKSLGDLTSQCIRCGFCLEACPTFLETGSEADSPRGRIQLARDADAGRLEWSEARENIDRCLGCRACEPACPSGVQYGKILELARDQLLRDKPRPAERALLAGLSDSRMARLQMTLAQFVPGKTVPAPLSRMLSGEPPEAWTPAPGKSALWPELDEAALPSIEGSVALLEGCVMRVLFPRVHQATRRLLRRVGWNVLPTDLGCCGALHAHSGFLSEAEKRAKELGGRLPEGVPLIVNSAGCGSTLKEYGSVVGQGLEQVAAAAQDASEFLLSEGLAEHLAKAKTRPLRVAYHDACHLAHGQRITQQPRALISAIPGVELVEIAESALCCGSAGIYNVAQPAMARRLLERKWSRIEAVRPDIVVSGNPGCHAWIAQGAVERGSPVKVLHTLEFLEAALTGERPE
jgi:glycolate oxidase iron-sulfur subunit